MEAPFHPLWMQQCISLAFWADPGWKGFWEFMAFSYFLFLWKEGLLGSFPIIATYKCILCPPCQVPGPWKTGCTWLGVYVMMNYISLVYSQEVWNLNSFLLQTNLEMLIPSTEIRQTSVPFMVGLWFNICLKARAGTRWEGGWGRRLTEQQSGF